LRTIIKGGIMAKLKNIQKNLVKLMKTSKDKDLNKYYKDIEELPLKSFRLLVKILKKSKPLIIGKKGE
tara:strand:+ start:403 stop:606 length:204 start_codon:yes stop_codon:yes gene_type:complete